MARKIKKRELKDRILLVSEGKTEQLYFKGLSQELKISIEMRDIKKTSLGSLQTKVERIVGVAKKEGNPFTRVIFIIDKDDFQHYERDKINAKKNKDFHVFYSEPCFEYWLLLHFQLVSKPFNTCLDLQKSREFKVFFPNYNKTNFNIYKNLKSKLGAACSNAKNNPNTNINELVDCLQNMK